MQQPIVGTWQQLGTVLELCWNCRAHSISWDVLWETTPGACQVYPWCSNHQYLTFTAHFKALDFRWLFWSLLKFNVHASSRNDYVCWNQSILLTQWANLPCQYSKEIGSWREMFATDNGKMQIDLPCAFFFVSDCLQMPPHDANNQYRQLCF